MDKILTKADVKAIGAALHLPPRVRQDIYENLEANQALGGNDPIVGKGLCCCSEACA
eukprot:m.924904 g.924904  ORF g.924904 m.924904 type:complete len:57 (-) comp125070_c0_seq1:100-270(-)